jgi:hypothetical protein
MLQVFYLYVAYVALTIYVYCKCMFQMFLLFQTYVLSVLSGCCKRMVVNVSSISNIFYNKCFYVASVA